MVKRPREPRCSMGDRRLVFVTLVMLIFSGWSSGLVSATDSNSEKAAQSTDFGDEIRAPIQMSNPVENTYELRVSSGLIHSPYGSFDPLTQPIPLGPENLYDSKAMERTGFAIIQSNSADLTGVLNLVDELEITLVDYFPDDAVIVNIPSNADYTTILSSLNSDESVRWVGQLPIAWRVSPEVAALSGRASVSVDLDLIPSPILSEEELMSLASDLESISGELGPRGICDPHMCQPRSVSAIWLPILAMDGRILHIHEASQITIHNSNAANIAEITQALIDSGNSLNGTGEVIAISDTGLDTDHGDFEGRIRGIYNQFGPDNSHADSNSGHGTHVAATLLGDGSGDSNALGMVPAASFHLYQLEYDSSGQIARWGSLYEMFSHSWQNSARIQTNSWGNVNQVGQYSADSKSADTFIVDNPKFLVLFSSGEIGENGDNTVTPPGTAKNVLTIGASTTGSLGSEAPGSVPDFSSSGTTLDGRIKPDLVAPGVLLCSARAEEAASATGESCSLAMHDDGATPLYMAMNGSSMATAVAAGGAAQVRQYLRQNAGINEPGSDLIKALMINGAKDIGSLDIPNSHEGWGQIDIANTISPMEGATSLELLYDDSRLLEPGHSFVYTFLVDSTAEFDVTLVWVDREASTISNQTAAKIVNDLDLIVSAPDGTEYLGNHFSNGYSTTGGGADHLNNVERIKIGGGQSGLWTIRVGHAGGSSQGFALVATGLITEESYSDLTVFDTSLTISVEKPLQGDTILVEGYWKNQASQGTGSYSVEVWDITENSQIYTQSFGNLAGGALTSISFPHFFENTGDHILEIRLDSSDSVVELNDENSGLNNNILQISVEVGQIGVRITPLMDDGSFPGTPVQLEQALTQTLDPRLGSLATYQFVLQNEGTEAIQVGLSVTPVQIIDDQGILQAPLDEWWKLLNETGPWDLAATGDSGDSVTVTLTLEDVDADLSNPSGARYALPGTFVNNLNLYDKNEPTISHSIQISTVVERVEGIYTILAGTGEDLGAKPGEIASFTLSVRNTGNGPTQYSIICDNPSGWIVNIGNYDSNSVILDPISRLQFVPLSINVRIPSMNGGQPAAGTSETITCITKSVEDSSITTTESAVVNVFESKDFSIDLFDVDGEILGALATAENRAVLNGDLIETQLLVTNDGNIPMDFEMSISTSLNTWVAQLTNGIEQGESITFSVVPGDSKVITAQMMVPMNAEMGTMNTLTIRTTLSGEEMVTNGTRFIVQELAALEASEGGVIQVYLGQTGTFDVSIKNTGNVPLYLEWTIGSLPEGWIGGFQSLIPSELDMNREALVTVGLELPGNLPIGIMDEELSIIVEATTPGSELVVHTFTLDIEVLPSVWVGLSSNPIYLNDVPTGSESDFLITVTNLGNSPSGIYFEVSELEGWSLNIEQMSIEQIPAGESVEFTLSAKPSSSSSPGLMSFTLFANSTGDDSTDSLTNGVLELEVSRARDDTCSGISCILVAIGLPSWAIAVIFIFLLAALGVVLVRMRSDSISLLSPEEELIPAGSALHSGTQIERREVALETGSAGEVLSSAISEEEASSVRESSLPSLSLPPVPPGAMPLPPSGLPDGWTMEQWVAYGHLWYEQNK